jgi:Protein of unknown function (DUF2489)
MANPDKRTSNLRKLVSAARSILTYQTSLPLGCQRAARILYTLRPFEIDFPIFREFLDATRDLPTGTERLHWQRDALRERDAQLEKIIRRYRDKVFDACYEILDRYESASDVPPKVI